MEHELIDAPKKFRELIKHLPSGQVQKAEITNEANALAESYVKAKVVGETSLADCLHIAIATLSKADVLISWNFKHIVNTERINGYNYVNLKLGYKTLAIRTPKEVLHYEKD